MMMDEFEPEADARSVIKRGGGEWRFKVKGNKKIGTVSREKICHEAKKKKINRKRCKGYFPEELNAMLVMKS